MISSKNRLPDKGIHKRIMYSYREDKRILLCRRFSTELRSEFLVLLNPRCNQRDGFTILCTNKRYF